MFQARDYSLFLPSPNADRSFRLIRWMDYAIRALLVLLVLLCIWNIFELAQLRAIQNQDFEGIRDIRDDLSTRLIWMVTLITAGLVLVREWYSGFSTVGLLIPGSILLGLVLVPAVMTEIQPPLEDQILRVVMLECPPKAIVNDELSSVGRCEPRAINEGDALLALSDPRDGTVETIEEVAGGQNTITYGLSGRGTYTVYFMFRFDDMQTCEKSIIFPRGGLFSSVNHQCMEYDSEAWKVIPHTTAANMPSGVHFVQVTLP